MKSIVCALLVFYSLGVHAQTTAPSPVLGPPGRPVAITFLPVTITAPGNYYLATDLTVSPASVFYIGATAITVIAPGKVVIDMRGHTISGAFQVTQYWSEGTTPQGLPAQGHFDYFVNGIQLLSSDVTILNGTVSGFYFGLLTAGIWGPAAPLTPYISNILIDGVKFINQYDGVQFRNVNNSRIQYCTFLDAPTGGIVDLYSQTGNTYIDDVYRNIGYMNISSSTAANGTQLGTIFSNRPYTGSRINP